MRRRTGVLTLAAAAVAALVCAGLVLHARRPAAASPSRAGVGGGRWPAPAAGPPADARCAALPPLPPPAARLSLAELAAHGRHAHACQPLQAGDQLPDAYVDRVNAHSLPSHEFYAVRLEPTFVEYAAVQADVAPALQRPGVTGVSAARLCASLNNNGVLYPADRLYEPEGDACGLAGRLGPPPDYAPPYCQRWDARIAVGAVRCGTVEVNVGHEIISGSIVTEHGVVQSSFGRVRV